MFLFHLFLYTAEIQAADADGDGVDESVDCDDTNNMIYPNAIELCDQMDNNCDGVIDEGTDRTFWRDADGDDYGNVEEIQKGCSKPAGYVVNSQDCDDSNPTIHPAQTEICDTIDNNCNSEIDEGCAGNEPSYEGVNSNDPNEENTTEEQEDPIEEQETPVEETETTSEEKPNTSAPFIYETPDSGCGGSKSLLFLFPFLLLPFRRKQI